MVSSDSFEAYWLNDLVKYATAVGAGLRMLMCLYAGGPHCCEECVDPHISSSSSPIQAGEVRRECRCAGGDYLPIGRSCEARADCAVPIRAIPIVGVSGDGRGGGQDEWRLHRVWIVGRK